MYYTYVLQNNHDSGWYIGITEGLRKRIRQHDNVDSGYTKSRRPWHCIYYEACENRQDAEGREKYLQSGMGRRYLKNRLKRFLSLT